jgi:hypothetical protein
MRDPSESVLWNLNEMEAALDNGNTLPEHEVRYLMDIARRAYELTEVDTTEAESGGGFYDARDAIIEALKSDYYLEHYHEEQIKGRDDV